MGVGMTQSRAYHPANLQQKLLSLFAKDSLKYLTSRVLQASVGLLSTYLFTRWLSAAAYGEFSVVMGIVVPLLALLVEWAAQPAARFFRQYEVEGRKAAYRRVFVTLVLSVMVLAGLAALFLTGLGTRAWGRALALAAGTTLLVESILAVLVSIFPVSLQGGVYRVLEVTRAVARLAAAVALVRLLGATGAALVWAGVVSGLLVLVPAAGVAMRVLRVPMSTDAGPKQQWSWSDVARFARYGLPMMVWFFGQQFLALGDRLVISLYRGPAEVGVYAASYNLVNSFAQVLAGPILFAASPIIWRLWAEAPRAEVRKAINDISGWFLVLGAGLVGGFALLAREAVVILLGPEFHGGYIIVLPVVLGTTVWNLSMIGHKPLELAERTTTLMVAALATAGANLLLNFTLVPGFGMMGAAYATLISYALYAGAIAVLTRTTGLAWSLPVDRTLPSAVAVIGAFLVARQLPSADLAGTILRGLVFWVLYLVLFAGVYIFLRRAGSRQFGNPG